MKKREQIPPVLTQEQIRRALEEGARNAAELDDRLKKVFCLPERLLVLR